MASPSASSAILIGRPTCNLLPLSCFRARLEARTQYAIRSRRSKGRNMNRQSQRPEPRSASAAEEVADPLMYAPEGLSEGIRTLGAEPVFAAILERAGPPRFRRRRNGFGTLLHIILEQQVSIDAAAAMHRRLVGLCNPLTPQAYLALD